MIFLTATARLKPSRLVRHTVICRHSTRLITLVGLGAEVSGPLVTPLHRTTSCSPLLTRASRPQASAANIRTNPYGVNPYDVAELPVPVPSILATFSSR
jgi:hypothetical protein